MKNKPSVKEINSHVFAGTGYCYVSMADGRRMRISWARSKKGTVEGRVINTSGWTPKRWEVIPTDATVELS